MLTEKGTKGTKVTLSYAKKAIRMTLDGRRRLTLSNMGLTIFPKCLLKLTNLDELDLSRNLIQKLPDNIGNFTSLRWLDLHSNKLESLPKSIGNLVGLTHLNLSNNRLTSAGLPSTVGLLTNLKSLNLGLNQLDTLPSTVVALNSLQELGLFDNLFIKLPEFVTGLRNLKVNIVRNPLSYAQGEAEEKLKKKSQSEEEVYLVHESSLCATCLKRCKEQREGHTREGGRGGGDGGGGGGGDDVSEEKRMRKWLGLMAPNSVAAVYQDVWRIRKNEDKQIT